MTEDQDEWELSKENVQPLKHGRNVSSIAAAFQTQSAEQMARIKHEKQEFEAELRIYSGDDPLDVWDRYIKWTEENFPKGGKDGSLTPLLERCLIQFKGHEKYQDDPRYVDSWVKFANLCNDPLEIYSYMFDNAIGCGLAVFFDAWALALEQSGNTKRADSIYNEGLKRNAQPVDYLKRNHEKFQARVARGAVGVSDHVLEDLQEENRKVLGQLKIGKRNQVAANRNALGQNAKKSGLGLKCGIPAKQVGCTFQIFSEENPNPSFAPSQTGNWKSMPQRPKSNVENQKKPGVWTEAKVPQKHVPVVPVSSVSSHNAPAFQIHVDENVENNAGTKTPYKPPQDTTQVLSVRKKIINNDPIANIRQSTHENSGEMKQLPMYCKDLVYNGLEEFSFEEIRAAKYQAKRKKAEEERKRKAELEQIEASRKELLEFKKELELQQHEFRQEILESRKYMQTEREIFEKELKEKLQKELASQSASLHSSPPSCEDQNENKQSSPQLLHTTIKQQKMMNGMSPDMLTDNLTPSNIEPPAVEHHHLFPRSQSLTSYMEQEEKEKKVSKQLNFAEFIPQASKGDLSQNIASDVHQFHQDHQLSVSNRSLTPSDGSHHMSGNSNTFSGGKLNIAAPSPTVHTKNAMQVVMHMFNASLDLEKQFGFSKESDTEMETNKEPEVSNKPTNTPFVIYEEPEESCSKNVKQQSIILEDKENQFRFQKPENTRRRGFGEVPRDCFLSMPKNDFDLSEGPECEDKMDGIESQQVYHEDFTIGTVGSHASFAAAAKMSSTPFITTKVPEPLALASISSIHQSEDVDMSSQQNIQQQPSEQNSQTPGFTKAQDTKILSPIMEGSSDESSKGSTAGCNGHGGTAHLDDGSYNFAAQDIKSPRHLIDVSTYIPLETDDNHENVLSTSICINPSNPFDEADIARILDSLKCPLTKRYGYRKVAETVPSLNSPSALHVLSVGKKLYDVQGKIAEGGFANIYKLSLFTMGFGMDDDNCDEVMAWKVQKPACPWEFYISDELKSRLRGLKTTVDVSPSIVSFEDFVMYKDGSGGVMQYLPNGSLLDFSNKMKLKPYVDREPVTAYLAVELMHIVEKMHKCKIIHGDMKPDNFLMLDMPTVIEDPMNPFGTETRSVRLIDFGRSIDMTKYHDDVTFMAEVKTSGFRCIEMQTNRPWTYQTDLFGLIGTIHVILFGQYMKVYQSQGVWQITSNFVRKWNVPLWKKLFHELLNIQSCSSLPDLGVLRAELEKYFISHLIPAYNKSMEELKL